MRASLLIASALFASVALAEGPGSRIRTDPGVVAPPSQPKRADAITDTRRCDALPGAERERCLRTAREQREPSPRRSGPESTGMGSGSGASTATGHGSPGSSAPR